MSATKRRFPKQELRKRGEAIFEQEIKSQLKGRDPLDYVMIDIETRFFEVDADELAPCRRLREHNPDAQIWGRRVGSPLTRHFSGRLTPEAE